MVKKINCKGGERAGEQVSNLVFYAQSAYDDDNTVLHKDNNLSANRLFTFTTLSLMTDTNTE